MKKDKIKIETASQDHALAFYGAQPTVGFKGYAATLNGKVVGIGGISRLGDQRVVFSEFKEEMRPYKKDIARSIRLIMSLVKDMGVPVFAFADTSEVTSKALLVKLGFRSTGQDSLHGPIYVRMPWAL